MSLAARWGAMAPGSRTFLILLGYAAAFAVASAAVGLRMELHKNDADSQGGMQAFGDSVYFLAVFVVAAIPADIAFVLFLRPYRWVWRTATVLAPCISLTAVVALMLYLPWINPSRGSPADIWSMISPLRIVLAPALAIAFLVCGLLAPMRSACLTLMGSALVEAGAFCWVVLLLFR